MGNSNNKNSKLVKQTRNVNVWQYPQKEEFNQWDDFHNPEGSKKQLSLGDQHGNFLKILYSLIEQNVVDLPSNLYTDLVDLEEKHITACNKYQKEIKAGTLSSSKKADYQNYFIRQVRDFDAIIDKIQVLQPDMLVRFIGDVLADRGSNDYFTLALISKLKEKGLSFEVVLSNHDDTFLRPQMRLGSGQQNSSDNMGILKSVGALEKDKIESLTKDYIQSMKLFSYSIETDGNKITELHIFNHAIAGPECLKALIEKYSGSPHHIFDNVIYKDDTIVELCHTIDDVNEKFNLFLSQEQGIEKYKSLMNAEARDVDWKKQPTERTNPQKTPFHHLAWNRYIGEGDKWQPIENIPIRTAHGHVGEKNQYKENEGFNLDGEAGKFKSDLDNKRIQLRNPMLCAASYTSFRNLPCHIYKPADKQHILLDEFKAYLYSAIADIKMNIQESGLLKNEKEEANNTLNQLSTKINAIQDIGEVETVSQDMQNILETHTPKAVTSTESSNKNILHHLFQGLGSLIKMVVSATRWSNIEGQDHLKKSTILDNKTLLESLKTEIATQAKQIRKKAQMLPPTVEDLQENSHSSSKLWKKDTALSSDKPKVEADGATFHAIQSH